MRTILTWKGFLIICLLCIGILRGYTQNIALEWARGIGGIDYDEALYTIADEQGNTYTTGRFGADTVDFDPSPNSSYKLACKGSTDIFVVKLDPAGNLVWARQFGGDVVSPQAETGHALALDTKGNLLVAGCYTGTADFDPGPGVQNLSANGGIDAFLLKLDTGGHFVWAKSIGGPLYEVAMGICTDKDDNVYATGSFGGTVDFDPGTGTYNMTAGFADIFVLKLSRDGLFTWAKQGMASGLGNSGNGIVSDVSGHIYISAYKRTTLMSGLIWKMDHNGNTVWEYMLEGNGGQLIEAIALDGKGHVYATGTFEGKVDFNPKGVAFPLNSIRFTDAFVLKLDTSAHLTWVKQLECLGRKITVDGAGNVVSNGMFEGTVDFDPGPGVFSLTAHTGSSSPPYLDVYVLKLDAGGKFRNVFTVGGPEIDNAGGLAVDRHGSVYLSGMFGYSPGHQPGTRADFDPGTGTMDLISHGDGDLYIAKYYCTDTSSISATYSFCDSITLNGATFTEPGIYRQSWPNVLGCDSIITLNLSHKNIEPVIAVEGFELTTTLPYADYQWFLNGQEIQGATQQLYHVSENGVYTVMVTDDEGCSGLSDPYRVANAGIQGIKEGVNLQIFPNPATEQVRVMMPPKYRVSVYGIDGRIRIPDTEKQALDLSPLADGLYWLRFSTATGEVVGGKGLVKGKQ